MDALQDEVESLEAILMDDVHISRNAQSNMPELIETTIFPLADEQQEQHICVTLQVLPTAGYPDVSPEFKLLRPRGLDDVRLAEIRHAIEHKLQATLGFPVVFDLIEVVRENLTSCNLPSGHCVVCLYGFSDGDEFTRTECFHYLHSYCLCRHLRAARRNYKEEFNKLPHWQQQNAKPFKATCPVCRETIKDETDSLSCAMAPAELQNAPDFQLTQELREMQKRMSELFLQQKNRGAIIDDSVETAAGAVITLETETEMLHRLLHERHNQYETACEVSGSNATMPAQQASAQSNGINRIESKCKNAHPTAEQKQQQDAERENQPNRRHYRGGRRHQQHHYHQRDRERERERFEHNHMSSNSAAATAATTSQQHKHSAVTAAATTSSNAAPNKHAKSNAAAHAHNR